MRILVFTELKIDIQLFITLVFIYLKNNNSHISISVNDVVFKQTTEFFLFYFFRFLKAGNFNLIETTLFAQAGEFLN